MGFTIYRYFHASKEEQAELRRGYKRGLKIGLFLFLVIVIARNFYEILV